mgnify:CR=1 FL=1
MMRVLRVTMALALASLLAPAEDETLHGPVSGLLVDAESGSLRPILGAAGAAYAGAPAVRGVDYASPAADGQRALVARSGSLYLVGRLGAGAPVWRTLREDATDLGISVFSSDGASAVLHDAAHHRLELWKNLNDIPEPAGEIDLNDVPGRLVSLAIHNDGATVFAAFQENDQAAALHLLKPGAAPRLLFSLERAGVLLLDGDTLYVADRGRNEIVRLTEWDTAFQLTTVAAAGHGVADPVGLAVARDGKLLYIASRERRQVLAVDIGQQAVKAALDLSFRPTGLERSGNLLLLASGVPGLQPAQVLDPARFEVFFIPVSAAPLPVDSGASGT